MREPQVLVTGATGFVGRHLCHFLLALGFSVKAIGRRESFFEHPALCYQRISDIGGKVPWDKVLEGVTWIIHLAGRAHQLSDRGMQGWTTYQAVNQKGTQALIHAALRRQVRRFVYVSTIKVNGEKTSGTPFCAEDLPNPQGAYALSKYHAEQIVQEETRGMEWVIVRAPLVYGPFVAGNFRRLMQLANIRAPLPFHSMRARRSMVSVGNLCHFLTQCLTHSKAAREILLVSDNQDLSVAEWIGTLRLLQGRKPRLLPCPRWMLRGVSYLLGRGEEISRLLDPLEITIEKSLRLLQWCPPDTVESAVRHLLDTEDRLGRGDLFA